MQTRDFLYMVKGYDPDEGCDANPEEMETKFNTLVEDFVFSVNESTEEVLNHSNYMLANLEFNILTFVYENIENLSICQQMLTKRSEEIEIMIQENIVTDTDVEDCIKDISIELKTIKEIASDLLDGIKVERNDDLVVQLKKLKDKINFVEGNKEKYKAFMATNEIDDESEIDIDKQLINVFLGLEMPMPDENKLTLYQFSIMVDLAIERSKALEKLNSK